MIKFEGKIVQLGFGAVGKSFFELVSKEIRFDRSKYFVITKYEEELEPFIQLGGTADNFIVINITKENFAGLFSKYLSRGDLLIDFSEGTGTKELCTWCAKNNLMYINTGESEWPGDWVNFYERNRIIRQMILEISGIKGSNEFPIVLQHGNNPGLVSHFVKVAIERIARITNNKLAKRAIKEQKFNEAARLLRINTIHINDIDTQIIAQEYSGSKMYTTWCAENFFYEMLTLSSYNIGSHEYFDSNAVGEFGHVETRKLAIDTKLLTYYPEGCFEGFVVPHEETISIARNLEVSIEDNVIYRPTVLFVYKPPALAEEYMFRSRVNSYPGSDSDKPQDGLDFDGRVIMRGHKFPEDWEIVYDQIVSGAEYVGALLMGEGFDPVWTGNRLEINSLKKKANKKRLYWQTPTITPVAASALAAVCFMIKNKNKGGIYFPDNIKEYKYILKIAEKYISKTICKNLGKIN